MLERVEFMPPAVALGLEMPGKPLLLLLLLLLPPPLLL
jgi:hypothetical protein